MKPIKNTITYSICLSVSLLSQTFAQETTVLDEIKVSTENSNYSTQNDNYYKTKSQSATKTDTPVRETPQSVQVVSNEIIKELNAVKIEDVLDYTSGISRQNNFAGMWDNFSIRGFAGNENTGMSLLKNGFADNRGYNAPRDTANIESIEFLKGPSGSLYGNSEPGGTINIVTKEPKFTSEHSIKTDVGSYDFYRMALDSTAPINDNLAYRLNVATEKKGSFRDHIESQRYVVAPSLLYAISDDTFVSYMGEFIEQKAPFDRGIALIDGKNVMNPKNFLGNPDDGDVTLKNQTHQLKLEHYFSDSWSSRMGVAYKNNSLKGFGSEVTPATKITTDSINLRTRYRDYSSDDIQFQADLQNVADIKDATNTLLFGVETYRFEQDSILYTNKDTVRVDNIRSNPTYTVLKTGLGSLSTDKYEEQKGVALFVQDEVAYKDFRFLTGLRYDEVRMDNVNHLDSSSVKQNDYAVSPRVGITYLIDDMWSVYTTSGTSFRPNTGTDIDGKTFEPEKSVSIETGLKFESEDKKTGGTLSLYQIQKKNVLMTDPNDPDEKRAAGKVRSKGIEFDFNGKITDNIKANFNYTYTDAKVVEDSTYEGKELLNIPKHTSSVLLMWEDSLSLNSSYGIGTGVTYVGRKAGNVNNDFYLPDYTTAKIVSYYKVNKDLNFSLNIDNLFDEEYIASSYDVSWLTVGNPRTATLSMTYKF
ncbi:TonB-dependent siderophore receptor [Aliarcobacter butzleri]|uniref:TonB-dependent siderophore receptor n=1 Tax=Aliarcobacter butzleri TaxID=28197 RepID=UPI00263D95D9|nr:TonB-dependent siderophore receptor [Aliarcobacter butzleri]MDN5048787.1 TonB-dependent siderophore receptor [Aliarcobacter butzleri]MDN5056223.1 TonB-dependent siderophore receptor [Aliarcobacter butzleri]